MLGLDEGSLNGVIDTDSRELYAETPRKIRGTEIEVGASFTDIPSESNRNGNTRGKTDKLAEWKYS
jgi:hypothetical protein